MTHFAESMLIAKPTFWLPRGERGVDADHLTVGVHERTTRVARVDRGVGLQHVVERHARLVLGDDAALAGDDALGHARARPASASALPIATTSSPTCSESELPSFTVGRFLRVDLEHREVVLGRAAEQLRGLLRAVGERRPRSGRRHPSTTWLFVTMTPSERDDEAGALATARAVGVAREQARVHRGTGLDRDDRAVRPSRGPPGRPWPCRSPTCCAPASTAAPPTMTVRVVLVESSLVATETPAAVATADERADDRADDELPPARSTRAGRPAARASAAAGAGGRSADAAAARVDAAARAERAGRGSRRRRAGVAERIGRRGRGGCPRRRRAASGRDRRRPTAGRDGGVGHRLGAGGGATATPACAGVAASARAASRRAGRVAGGVGSVAGCSALSSFSSFTASTSIGGNCRRSTTQGVRGGFHTHLNGY